MIRKLISLTGTLLLLVTSLPGTPQSVLINKDTTTVQALVSASPPHSFTGAPSEYALDLVIDDATKSVVSAEFGFKFADFSTDKDKRDKKMWNWMEVEQNPDVQFSLKRVEATDSGLQAIGDFSMHGEVKEIAIPFTMATDGHTITLDAHYTLDHREWGLPKIRLFIFTVKPVMEIEIHVEGSYAG